MENDINFLKKSAFSSIIWKTMERFLAQSISLVVSIVLARILNPEDYSVVGIVTIFFSFANILISGGLNTALVQKKNADEEDYSTVLWISLFFSLIVYVVLFIFAPAISNIYKKDVITRVIRVMGLTLPINAIKAIYCAYVSSRLEFKKFFYSTLVGTLFSAVVGILMALLGFGPWALVAQQMSNAFIDTIVLIFSSRIQLVMRLSIQRFIILFKYGWKVFATSLISTSFQEIKPLVIGIKFNASDLSFYSKGESFPKLLGTSLTNSFSAVLFPLLSKFQDNIELVLTTVRRFVRLCSFILFPLMIGLFVVSDNFVLVLLGPKWIWASPYIKIFALVYLLDVVSVANLEAVKAIGNSKVLLISEIVKKSLFFFVTILFIVFASNPPALAFSAIICSIIGTSVNAYIGKRSIGYNVSLLLYDLLPNAISSIVMGVGVFCVGKMPYSNFILLLFQILAGVIIYILVNALGKNESFVYLFSVIKQYVERKKNG